MRRIALELATIALILSPAALLSHCGHVASPCTYGGNVEDTFAVTVADFDSFSHDDGELDEIECVALCACRALAPDIANPRSDDASALDAETPDPTEGGGMGGTPDEGGASGPGCFSGPPDPFPPHWQSCTYRPASAGYRLVHCLGIRRITGNCR